MEESVSAISCSVCGSQMPGTAAFCPGCGRSMVEKPVARGRVGIFPEPIAAALAYFTFVPAIVFLTLDPYRNNTFLRFHSVQCLLMWVAGLVIGGALRLISAILSLIPVVGPLLVWLIAAVASLAAFFVWVALVAKAIQGEAFHLPILGAVAERYADPL